MIGVGDQDAGEQRELARGLVHLAQLVADDLDAGLLLVHELEHRHRIGRDGRPSPHASRGAQRGLDLRLALGDVREARRGGG